LGVQKVLSISRITGENASQLKNAPLNDVHLQDFIPRKGGRGDRIAK
jgi:hypothetical protein